MQRLIRSPLAWLLLVGVMVGLLIGNDYGASYDEQDNADVGAAALRTYGGSTEYFSMPALADHGPFYFMAFSVGSILPASLFPGWGFADGRHLTNYLTFLAGVVCLYVLARRWVPRGSAWLAALLFVTQPLLFGHAFINQKDIPFMTFFLASIAAGVVAVDRWAVLEQGAESRAPGSEARSREGPGLRVALGWRSLRAGVRIMLAVTGAVCAAVSADLLFGRTAYHLGEAALIAAHAGRAGPLVQAIFDRAAPGARASELAPYVDKYEFFFAAFRFVVPMIMIAGWLCFLAWALPRLRERWRWAWSSGWILPLALSGALLGCTISIRQVGFFAGGLVGLYWLSRTRRAGLVPLALYLVLAMLTTYATWPYLWRDPWGGLLASFQLAGDFPSHKVLFQGEIISSRALPWEYFPVLAGLQLTVPAVLLILIGGWQCLRRWSTAPGDRPALVLLALWIVVPLVNLMCFGMSAYGNIRHLLFVLPALFLAAATALDAVLTWLRRPALQYLVAAVIVLPGIVGIVGLHPYEYIYYNRLIGGVDGAYGRYELDRWCTSYREAAEGLNHIAEPGASVLVYWPVQNATPYMRQDLQVLTNTSQVGSADFVMVCTRQLGNDVQPEGYRRVIAIQQGKAVLAEVWQRP